MRLFKPKKYKGMLSALFDKQTIDSEEFLNRYWQQRPFLFKNTRLDLSGLPDRNQMFALAAQEDVQSRIVYSEDGVAYQAIYDEPEAWEEVEAHNPTLLVSDIEKWHPEARSLLTQFPFVKSWRLDDLMMSFAPTGASVGAHTDHYDVFLIQVKGTRSWSFDDAPLPSEASLVAHSELSVLADYQAKNQHTLSPGDVLYLPPEIAHHGVSMSDDCITCSVGLRAPSQAELVMAFAEMVASRCNAQTRFKDPQRSKHNPHDYDQRDVEQFKKLVHQALDTFDDSDWHLLFGQTLSQYRTLDAHPEMPSGGDCLRKNPFVTFTYTTHNKQSTLFVGGETFAGEEQEIKTICESETINNSHSELIRALVSAEFLI